MSKTDELNSAIVTLEDEVETKDAAIDILRTNICHCQIETYEGLPTGNVYVGMTCDDYCKLVEILGSLQST